MKHTIKTKRNTSGQLYKRSQLTGSSKQGFTLIELIISVFIFLLIMTATVTIFTREITAYRIARETQKSLENAQFTLNFIAKTLRTSQINKIVDSPSGDVVYAYDHSQGRCFIFTFDLAGEALMMEKESANNSYPDECINGVSLPSMEDPTSLTIGKVTGNFEGRITEDGDNTCTNKEDCVTIGAITTSLVIEPESGVHNGPERVYVQSTASLRDYPNAGIPL